MQPCLEHQVVVDLAVAVLHEDGEQGVQYVRKELDHLGRLHLAEQGRQIDLRYRMSS